MRLERLRRERLGDRVRVAADIVWEDCGRPVEPVYVESPLPWGEDLEPAADAFLAACAVPALEHGERRVCVDGVLCPELRNGVAAALRLLRHWFPGPPPPTLESARGLAPGHPRRPARAASFMSSGLDALATLRKNRLTYPPGHEQAIRDCLCLFGLNSYEFRDGAPVPERLEGFAARLRRLEPVAVETGAEMIPVYTNVRFLLPSFEAWNRRGHTAGLAAVAHAFGRRVSRALMASDGFAGLRDPGGTHPAIAPLLSSAAVDMRVDGLEMARIDKTALIAAWPVGLAALQSYQRHEALIDRVNCGTCNKCLRTMIHLAALGALGRATVFPFREITPAMLAGIVVRDEAEVDFLAQAIAPFERIGRADLAEALRARLRRHAWHVARALPRLVGAAPLGRPCAARASRGRAVRPGRPARAPRGPGRGTRAERRPGPRAGDGRSDAMTSDRGERGR